MSPSKWAPVAPSVVATCSSQAQASTPGPDGLGALPRLSQLPGRRAAERRSAAHRLRFANVPDRSLSCAKPHIHFSWSSNLTATALYTLQIEMDGVFRGWM